MKIKVEGYESPYVLRALAALLTTLADEPQFRKGCAEPCDGSVRTEETEPGEPSETLAAGYEIVGQVHDETYIELAPTGLVVPPPPPAPVIHAAHGFRVQSPPIVDVSAEGERRFAAVDKTGTPWDARIHSSSRALVANGTWRLKKGVDKTLVESVTRELHDPRRAEEIGQTAMFAPIEDALVVRALDAALVSQPPSTVNPAPHAAASTVQTTHVGVAGVVPPPPLPFNEISRFFAVHCMAGKLTHADMEAMAKHSGVEYTQDLMTAANADKRPAALAYLQSLVDRRA